MTSASGISIACVFMYMCMRACGVCVDKEREKKLLKRLEVFRFFPSRCCEKKLKKMRIGVPILIIFYRARVSAFLVARIKEKKSARLCVRDALLKTFLCNISTAKLFFF